MLKKQYKIFLLVFAAVCVLGAVLSKRFPYSYDTISVGAHTFSLSIEDADPDAVPVRFSFADSTATLHIAEEYAANLDTVSFRYPYGDADTAPLDGFAYSDAMNGTLFVQTSSEDGTVLATAKSSTLNTQGYDSFAWDSHVFGTEDIPLEFCYGGSSTMSTQATLLCWGNPYSGIALIRSNAGKNESVTITDGVITGWSIQDLRSGVSAAVVEEETGRTLIASYIAEDYLLFSDCDPGSLQALGMLILLTAAGCLLVIVAKTCLKRSRG